MRRLLVGVVLTLTCVAFANPYWDPNKVPKDPKRLRKLTRKLVNSIPCCRDEAVLRVQLDWASQTEKYTLGKLVSENSGTPAFFKRAKKRDALGSYQAELIDFDTQAVIGFDSIGTGMEYRKLVRALTFRFPMPKTSALLIVRGENPTTGASEMIFRQMVDPSEATPIESQQVESKLLKAAEVEPSLKVNFYSDGFVESAKAQFFEDADHAVSVLKSNNFPSFKQMEFHAVFSPSNTELGEAENLGLPIAERDSFLGLYFPYWDNFGRWYNIVYPTREARYRSGLAQVPYDYPIILMDSSEYWGVGNFNEITAIPTKNFAFTYLLMHEFGHYFGLNEEYEGGGATELQFAPKIEEPWSQNITFLKDPAKLKWKSFALQSTPIPTPSSLWKGNGPWGAYKGGYAQSQPINKSHKPGFGCVMHSGAKFCPVCIDAIEKKVSFDLGN